MKFDNQYFIGIVEKLILLHYIIVLEDSLVV